MNLKPICIAIFNVYGRCMLMRGHSAAVLYRAGYRGH